MAAGEPRALPSQWRCFIDATVDGMLRTLSSRPVSESLRRAVHRPSPAFDVTVRVETVRNVLGGRGAC